MAVTLLTVESFDHADLEGPLSTKNGWTTSLSFDSVTFDTGVACSGIACSLGASRYLEYLVPSAARDAKLVLGLRWNPANSAQALYRFYGDTGSTEHIRVVHNTANQRIDVYRGPLSALLGSTADGSVVAGQWVHVDIEAVLHDTTGSVKVWLDGALALNLTGVDTRNGGSGATLDYWVIGAANGLSVGYIEDLYALTGAGGTFTAPLGEVAVEAFRPAADGASADWTPSTGTDRFATVDEYVDHTTAPGGGGMPNTTDYNASSTNGATDLFTLGRSPAVTGILAIQHVVYGLGAGSSIVPVVRSAGTTYAGTAQALTGSYRYYTELSTTDPATGLPWTWQTFHAAEWGYRLAGSSAARVTQYLVEVLADRRWCGGGWRVGSIAI